MLQMVCSTRCWLLNRVMLTSAGIKNKALRKLPPSAPVVSQSSPMSSPIMKSLVASPVRCTCLCNFTASFNIATQL